MELERAHNIGKEALRILAPFCERIEIAGSIRRQKPAVKDIELVCIPKRVTFADLLQENGRQVAIPEFVAAINAWPKLKGEPTGRYTQRQHPAGIVLDIFMTTQESWGLIFAIRTGSAEFSHQVLATGWMKKGFKSEGGILTRAGVRYPVPEETDLFNLIGLDWIEPKNRTI